MRRKNIKKAFSRQVYSIPLTLCLMFALCFVITPYALAAGGEITDGGTYDIGSYGSNSTITIGSNLTVTLTNTGNATFTNLQIDCGEGVDLTIDGVIIDNSATIHACALSFTGSGNSLTLVGDSSLASGVKGAGVRVESVYEGTSSLEIKGEGRLTATGGYGSAGIGGGDGGEITISSGTVTAIGGAEAAGIGGGNGGGDGGTVTISGGTVTATGGIYGGAGIGGGSRLYNEVAGGDGGTITISGGTVTATGGGGGHDDNYYCGAGIGGGDGGDGGDITISGGTVIATGGSGAHVDHYNYYGGAGIGGGAEGDGGTISIKGGTVTATGGYRSAGIGGGSGDGEYNSGGTISISDGKVTATGGSIEYGYLSAGGAGIGGGKFASGGTIAISGGEVTATGESGAGIGGGAEGDGGTISIKGGTVTASGGEVTDSTGGKGAGIGGGSGGDGGTISIEDGTINASGGEYGGAGIGGGNGGDGGTISIKGGTVTATGGEYIEYYSSSYYYCGAGIGGGYHGDGGDITISGGTVDATGRYESAGIGGGGGYHGAGGTITISGGTVIATGDYYGAGIGGGYAGNGGDITISGGTVTATGGEAGGAGIGSGDGYELLRNVNGGEITISGGEVTATGSDYGAGIGGGKYASGGTVSIEGGTVNAAGGEFGAGIGGGWNSDGGTVTVSGGSINASGYSRIGMGEDGSDSGTLQNADGIDVYLTTVTLVDVSGNQLGAEFISSLTAVLNSTAYDYGVTDMYTDASGKLYLYLPADTVTSSAHVDSSKYEGSVTTANDSAADGTLQDLLPTVTGVTPNGTGAALNGNNIAITFSEEMDTLTAGSVSLDGGSTPLTSGTWSSATAYTIPYSVTLYSTEYTVTVSGFTDTAGNEMTADSSNSFTTIAEPDTVVDIAAIGGVTAPVRGGTPVTAITESDQYTGTVSWSPNDSAFAASTTYTATITLTPKSGYTLTGVIANLFTVDGATSVSNSADSGVVTAIFPATAEPDTVVDIAAIGGVTAPVRGGTPVTAITESDQYTGTVSWSPNDSAFAASTTYTATITLTPKSGYTLTGVTANFFTVAGASTVSNSADSGVITAIFPATEAEPDTVVDIAAIGGVTVPVRGGTPVTAITESDQYTGTVSWSPNDSAFAASTTYTATITLTPKSGYTLTGVIANLFTVAGATSVSNSADSGVVTAIFPATAEPDTVVDIAAIGGVTAPVRGGTPVTAITESDQYTGTVSWSPNDSAFAASTTYTATITLTPKSGYTLTGVTANLFTVDGATSVSNSADSGVVTAIFPATAEPDTVVDIAAIGGVTVPVRGGTPVTAITESDQYTGTVSWSPNDSAFAASTTYTATITLTPKSGYTLTGVTANFFTVAGASTVSNSADSGVITAIFPATEAEPDTVVDIAAIGGVTAPVRGGTPVTAITESDQYTGTVSWSPNDSAFAANTTYTATITLTPKSGYTLTGVTANLFTVDGATSVSNSADSGVITAIFPATEAEPDTVVDIAAIGGVTAPVRGGTPVTVITESDQYTGTVSWSPNDSAFAASTTYTATITLTPKSGYTLTGVTANFFTVDGATSVSNSADSGVVTAIFPATEAEHYGIGLNQTGTCTFSAQTVGYSSVSTLNVTVSNTGNVATGNLTVALSGNNTDSFALSATSINSIAESDTAAFTVKPNTGLTAGIYTATVTVSGDNNISESFDVSFTVNEASTGPTYGVSLSQSGTYTFATQTEGYSSVSALSVTVSNTGNQATGDLTVALSGDDASSFTLSATSVSSIVVSGNGSFTAEPNTELSAGTYTATVTVSGDNNISESFDVSFTVNEASTDPTYTASVNPTSKTFTSATAGYCEQTAQEFTISNTGTGTISSLTAQLTTGTYFEISTELSAASISSGGTATVSVRPVTGFCAGTYTDTLTITGDNGISLTVSLSFTVTDTAKPTVTGVTPSGTSAAISGSIVVTFSKAMDTSIFGTVSLDGGSTYLTGGRWSSTTVYTIPYSGLSYSTGFIVDISGFADTLGNVMDENINNSFTTKSKSSSSSGSSSSSANKDEDKDKITISDDEGNTVTGTLTKTDNGAKAEISRDDFDELAEESDGNVTLNMEIATVTFSGDAVDTISSASDTGDISLTVETVDTSSLSDEAQKIVGDRTVYDITLMADDTWISDLDGTVRVNLPYEIADGEDPNAIVVYYVDDEGNLTPVGGRYDAETGTVEFTVTHFSVYAVGYNEVMFEDVAEGAWYYDAVTFCAAREITTGTGDGTFSPDDTLTRGQFIVMLMRAYGIETDEDITGNFDDAGDTYYTGYLAVAKQLGISNGTGDNMFNPEQEITRQNMFTLLYRALDVLGELPEADGTTALTNFSDEDEISDYAEEAMKTFVAAGIVSGDDEGLDPLGNSTRAQMAQVLYNLLNGIERVSGIASEEK